MWSRGHIRGSLTAPRAFGKWLQPPAIAMVDDDPNIKPMNPAYLLQPGELRANFEGWELLHDFEGKPVGDPKRRATAEIVARRLL